MAITRITYTVTRTFFQEGILPKEASVLEFGKANLSCLFRTVCWGGNFHTLLPLPSL
jgi:hypothetical protein